MILNSKTLLLCVGTLCLVTSVWLYLSLISYSHISASETDMSSAFHPLLFWEPDNFYTALEQYPAKVGQATVTGGVVPHHLLASDMIAEFFSQLPDNQTFDRIVLFSPNHFSQGSTIYLTSYYGWDTPVRKVPSDTTFISTILEEIGDSISVDEIAVRDEHGIGGLMPFIATYLPDVPVVPLVLSIHASLTDIEALAETLSMIDDVNTLYIASVDFSHYLTRKEADINDAETIQLLYKQDHASLFKLSTDHLDSPQSIAALQLLMENTNSNGDFTLLRQQNSADYDNSPYTETTSYITIRYTE